ncbi:MAG: Flp family type IVb pilin [Chloroflexi bacterium]|nr:Flp family type IVb pilin [Chloroflexota bacterium]
MKMLRRFWKDESAPTMPEYALMVALVAIVAIVGAQLLGTNILARLNQIAAAIGP